jgi:hypothetical protein
MGMGADPVPGMAIGLDMAKWGWVGQVIEFGEDGVVRGRFKVRVYDAFGLTGAMKDGDESQYGLTEYVV